MSVEMNLLRGAHATRVLFSATRRKFPLPSPLMSDHSQNLNRPFGESPKMARVSRALPNLPK